jgi:hypothetical protein
MEADRDNFLPLRYFIGNVLLETCDWRPSVFFNIFFRREYEVDNGIHFCELERRKYLVDLAVNVRFFSFLLELQQAQEGVKTY